MRYSVSHIVYLGTGDGEGKIDKKGNIVFAVIDNDDDSIIAEFATSEEALQHLNQLGEQQ
jgi:hypothetical protein